jgi:hypothetical protein
MSNVSTMFSYPKLSRSGLSERLRKVSDGKSLMRGKNSKPLVFLLFYLQEIRRARLCPSDIACGFDPILKRVA